MRWRFEGWSRGRAEARTQARMAFVDRAERRARLFKRIITGSTLLIVLGVLVAARPVRQAVARGVRWARREAIIRFDPEAARPMTEAAVAAHRSETVAGVRESLARYDRTAPPAIRALFRAAAMDPGHALIGSGRADNAFVLSSAVFEPDEAGRATRLRPSTRSVWLRQITLLGGPFSLLLVPDTPEARRAAVAAGGIVEESSAQSTNTWGLRGPEPDPAARLRLIVLGDSFMQGMFVGDDDTPPARLAGALRELRPGSVSVLNTGQIGHAPEQYFASLRAFGERFRPHFVVIGVCPNDFGDEGEVMLGRGDDWAEAEHYLGAIVAWCRSRAVPFLLVPAPTDGQVSGLRKDGRYPGRVSDLFPASGSAYLDPLDAFIDEHLRLRRLPGGDRAGPGSPLFNGRIGDGHFSPLGSALWAKRVARRVDRLLPPTRPDADPSP